MVQPSAVQPLYKPTEAGLARLFPAPLPSVSPILMFTPLHETTMPRSFSPAAADGTDMGNQTGVGLLRFASQNLLTVWQDMICIQAVSVYGQPGVLAQGLECPIQPRSHGPGGSHTISVGIVSRMSGRDVQTIRDLASIGEWFIKLDWTFPGHTYPKFTTRHLLVLDSGSGDVSFSGGLKWARRIHNSTRALDRSAPASMPPPGTTRDGWKWPLQPPFESWPARGLPYGPAMAGTPDSGASGPADDQTSVCSDLTSAPTLSDTETEPATAPASPPPTGSEPPWTPCGCCTRDGRTSQPQQQLLREMFQRQKRDAEALYAHNGDARGLLAVMAAAAQFRGCSWDP
ncbi:hypothetical protein BT67DRAFT_287280 [Trichocladium antarcticum]|uniref:Uncharacterized protein n=1 Tax=Trichocladium antarcticum TaxID=1450529 RepID=A0AAN6ULI0_9PEZI|nr:hypothetical protein BT67DRAFT_287280 [Trichocladium antarcticum]